MRQAGVSIDLIHTSHPVPQLGNHHRERASRTTTIFSPLGNIASNGSAPPRRQQQEHAQISPDFAFITIVSALLLI
jgi:hypothetical protein